MIKVMMCCMLLFQFFGIREVEEVDPTQRIKGIVIVNKKINQLALIQLGKLKKVYPVATGKTMDLTPEGEFTIIHRAEDPYYIAKKIPGGSPENPLGTRWLGFNARGTNGTKYGIHGTNQPQSIGKYISNGCIRMYNKDVEEIYGDIPYGSIVYIVNSSESFQSIGKRKGWIY